MSTSTLESEKEELNSVEMVLAEEIKKEEKEPENPLINETMSEDRSVACGNKSDSKELKEMVSPDKEKKKEDSKAEQEFVLDETNPHFAFLLAGENRDPAQSVLHAKNAFEHSNGFMWTMKKRLAFDEGCWKHLSRRIGAIRAEVREVDLSIQIIKLSRDSKSE